LIDVGAISIGCWCDLDWFGAISIGVGAISFGVGANARSVAVRV
jgi:hypothetical protein